MSYVVGFKPKGGGWVYLLGFTPSGCCALDWTDDKLCARKMTQDEADQVVLELGVGYVAEFVEASGVATE